MPPISPGWSWISRTLGEPALNMAFDEALLEGAISHARPILRFYGWTQPAATFGYFQKHAEIAALTPLRPLIRRPTAGGLVPHAIDWTYSIAVPPGHSWYELSATQSYQRLHLWLSRAFAKLELQTKLAPAPDPTGPGQCFVGAETHDLLFGRRKIAGAAQRRNKHGLLIQGSVQPLKEWSKLRDAWELAMLATESAEETGANFEPCQPRRVVMERAEFLAAEKYSSESYTHRR